MFRRSFLQKSIFGIGAAALSTGRVMDRKMLSGLATGRTGFMAECGVLGKDENYLLGFLMVDNPQMHEDGLAALRVQHGYRSKLTYRSNDFYKVEYAKAAIDYFMNTSDMVLVLSREVLPDHPSGGNYSLKQINTFKIDFTNSILGRYGSANTPDNVVSKYHSLNGPSIGFVSEFENETNIDYQARVTHDSDLLQLSSFLCGSITAIINEKVTHPVKVGLIDYLSVKVGISDFGVDQNTSKIKFYV